MSLLILNYRWWCKIQKPREIPKVILKIQFTLISQNDLFTSMKSLPSMQVTSACRPLFCFSRKVTSKNLPLVSCFVKSRFWWQSVEIRFPYHLGSIYAKSLALTLDANNSIIYRTDCHTQFYTRFCVKMIFLLKLKNCMDINFLPWLFPKNL